VFLSKAQGKAYDKESVTDLAQRLWVELAKHPDELLKTAWNGSLDSIGSFMHKAKGKAKDEKGTDLAQRLWAELAKHPDELLKTAWNGSLNAMGSFMAKALGQAKDEKGTDLAQRLWLELAKHPEELLKTAWNGSLDSIGSFAEAANKQCRELGWFWKILEADPVGCAKKGLKATTHQIAGLGNNIPHSFLAKLFRDVVPGHWKEMANKGPLRGASWAIDRLIEAKREDLADDLLVIVLDRRAPEDFPPPNGNYLAACRIAAMAKDKDLPGALPFLTSICTADNWLQQAYDYESVGQLATGLRTVVLSMGMEGCILLHSGRLHRRLAMELENGAVKDARSLVLALQLLGCAVLAKWDVKPQLLAYVDAGKVQELPVSILQHRSETTRVEPHQYQLWLGLRSFASIRWESIPCAVSILERTLELWRANHDDSSVWPDSIGHKLDDDMVRWLENCLLQKVPAIGPTSTPLWNLTAL